MKQDKNATNIFLAIGASVMLTLPYQAQCAQNDELMIVGQSKYQDVIKQHPLPSKVQKSPDEIHLVYQNEILSSPSVIKAAQSANALELVFDKANTLSEINLIRQ
jgi:hypothetical protein